MTLNPALELKEYITSNLGDSGGTWEYGHTPHIESVLKSLNEKQAEEFSAVIWEWENYHLYQLADPILWNGNKNINENYLYAKIFSLLDEPEQLVYLAQNLRTCIECSVIKDWENNLLKDIENNLYYVINYVSESWIKNHLELIDFINNELSKRTTSKNV
ncbi:hypothetical protein [Winogradskyella tangerina]|uniref:hypothetical protein n=1 Tax=Winogradskyella tangerina TaxID=2023240 RepID=UPI000DBE4AF1|nr:hypothetical protein [Winogradskyella tangerina]